MEWVQMEWVPMVWVARGSRVPQPREARVQEWTPGTVSWVTR